MKKLFTFLAGSLLIGAAQAAELNVYTYDSFVSEWGPGPQLETLFEKQCDCDLNFVAVEDGVSILNRLRIEGEQTEADVVLGLDNALLTETLATELIVPHKVDLAGLKPELDWNNEYFVPFDYGYFAFVYDSSKIEQPPASLRELVASKASVIYQDPRTSTPGQGLLLWMKAVYGDDAAQAWKQLAQHTVTVTKGWWEAYSMFLEGGADYVLSYSTSPAYHVISEENDQYRAALFSEGHVVQVEVAARLKSSKQPELAQQFLAFLVSEQAQQIIPVTNWMLPVVEVELPAVFDELIQPRQIGFSADEVAKNRKDWLKEWRNAAAR